MGMIHGDTFDSAMEIVVLNIQEIITLVNDILFLQEMDLILLEFEPIDIGVIAASVVEQQRERAELNRVGFRLSIASNLPLVMGDARSLQRVVNILLDNAIKFSPEGGDTSIEVNYDDQFVWVKVSDTGVGIPPEAMPRLFRRFFRLDEVGGHLFTGSGMGLSIARQVIDQHEGDILVESELGKGSVFTIRLKRAP
jgi:two-component system phosphate regulon sensor histidine kinase PhoR